MSNDEFLYPDRCRECPMRASAEECAECARRAKYGIYRNRAGEWRFG